MSIVLLIFLYRRIVDRIMQSAAFLALHCLAGDQVTDVDHVTQFAQLFGGLATFEEAFRLFVQDVQAVPGASQTRIAADDADVCLHDLVYLLHALGDQHAFFGGDRTFVVPFGDVGVEVVAFEDTQDMFGCRIRIYDCFDQRIGSQTVSTVQAGAGTFADGIETADAGLSVQVDTDTTAQIMGCRSYRDIILRDIDTDAEAFLIDIGEMLFVSSGSLWVTSK